MCWESDVRNCERLFDKFLNWYGMSATLGRIKLEVLAPAS